VIGVFDALRAEIASVPRCHALGRVAGVARGTIRVTGLEHSATLGDRVMVGEDRGALALGGEVLTLAPDGLTILTDNAPEGLPMGAEVKLYGQSQIAPDDSWIGRIVDPFGVRSMAARCFAGRCRAPCAALPPLPLSAAGLGNDWRRGLPCSTPCCRWRAASASGCSRVLAWANPRCWPSLRAGFRQMSWSLR
jgi:flagellum-specific ATP synthase